MLQRELGGRIVLIVFQVAERQICGGHITFHEFDVVTSQTTGDLFVDQSKVVREVQAFFLLKKVRRFNERVNLLFEPL